MLSKGFQTWRIIAPLKTHHSVWESLKCLAYKTRSNLDILREQKSLIWIVVKDTERDEAESKFPWQMESWNLKRKEARGNQEGGSRMTGCKCHRPVPENHQPEHYLRQPEHRQVWFVVGPHLESKSEWLLYVVKGWSSFSQHLYYCILWCFISLADHVKIIPVFELF